MEFHELSRASTKHKSGKFFTRSAASIIIGLCSLTFSFFQLFFNNAIVRTFMCALVVSHVAPMASPSIAFHHCRFFLHHGLRVLMGLGRSSTRFDVDHTKGLICHNQHFSQLRENTGISRNTLRAHFS